MALLWRRAMSLTCARHFRIKVVLTVGRGLQVSGRFFEEPSKCILVSDLRRGWPVTVKESRNSDLSLSPCKTWAWYKFHTRRGLIARHSVGERLGWDFNRHPGMGFRITCTGRGGGQKLPPAYSAPMKVRITRYLRKVVWLDISIACNFGDFR